jgi:RNA polymerase sigma factor (sigma-70 family)
MALTSFDTLMSYLRRMPPAAAAPEQEDSLLLTWFSQGDDGAFATLVKRYGPLVWGVCSRILLQVQDAEDAFQATFFVLARKASSLRGTRPLGPWLHCVASRIAVKARARAARRSAREATTAATTEPAVEAPDGMAHELRTVLDEEVGRLPEKYRLPVVLCYLEGLTNEEAARRLACPHGTILSRLARAREQLRGRLLRRGFGFPAAVVAVALGQASVRAVPGAVLDKLLSARLVLQSGLSASAITLAEGVLSEMFLSRLKIAGLALLALVLAASGAGLFASRPASPARASAPSPPPRLRERRVAVAADEKPAKKDKPEEKAVKPVGKPAQAKVLDSAAISAKLNSLFDFQGYDDPKTTLIEALDVLGDLHSLQFDVNELAFKAENVNEPSRIEIANPTAVPRMKGTLRRVLKKILARVPVPSGATYLIRKDHIEITTEDAVRRELHLPVPKRDENSLPLERLTLVWQDFKKVPLDRALADLAEDTNCNVVIDARVEEKTTVKVTARLANVPLDTAVAVLADMAGLEVVRMDNVLYVTSPESAAKLRTARKGK